VASTAERWRIENERLLEMFRAALDPGDGFLDVGANVGMFAIPVARHLGAEGKVFAFEPAPDMAEALMAGAEAEGVADRIDLHQIALGAEDGILPLRADPEDPANATKRSLFGGGQSVAEVQVRPLDDLVASGELPLDEPGIRVVKIDVEGAEVPCLRGMRSTLHQQRPALVLVETIEEHLHRAGSELGQIHGELERLGYHPDDTAPELQFNTAFVPHGSGHESTRP
jgi:FkbM family methyltransferase